MTTSVAAVNETVSFIATGGGGSGGYTCSWDFGDNTSATGCSASHAWNATGSYRVLLSVIDSSGHHGSSAQSVDVIMALIASFRVGPTPAIVGETAQIIAHPTGGIGPYNCTWDSVEASVISTLMGNVKRLSRWRPRRGAGQGLSRLPGKESGSEADQGAGGGDHQGPVQ